MPRRTARTSWPMLLVVVLALGLWLFQEIPAGDAARAATSDYQRFDGSRWVDHRQNDGDSFRVRLRDGRVEQFRLYFVDAPESAFRTYGGGSSNHDRIADQAADLGVTPERAVALGKEAARFVEELLGQQGFTVFTRWEDPFGDRRFHAFIEAPDGELRWVHERLVVEGLVRIHTKGADVPGGRRRGAQEKFLRELEAGAREAGAGAWSRQP